MALLETGRVVNITYQFHGQPRVGSGLMVGGSVVLTADHVAKGSGHEVLGLEGTYPASVLVRSGSATVDIALLSLDGAPDLPFLTFGRVERQNLEVLHDCTAVGFPRFKAVSGGRIAVHAYGSIPTAEGLRAVPGQGLVPGYLALKVENTPRDWPPIAPGDLETSQWAGMSGSAVLSATNDLIGVVRHHNPSEGPGSLALTPIEAIDTLPEATREVFWRHLGLNGPEDLKLLPRKEAKPDLSRAFTPLFRSRRSDGFVGRRQEIAALSAFADGPGGVLAVTGRPGFGKTSLLAEFAQQMGARAAFHFFTSRYDPYWLDEVFFLRNVLQQLSPDPLADDYPHLDRLSLQSMLHQRLSEATRSNGTPDVLILDGIDEIQGWSIANYVAGASPKHLHVIVSIRDTGQEWRSKYRLQGPDVKELRLDGFGEKSVVELFSATGPHTAALIQRPGALAAVMRAAAIGPLDATTNGAATHADPLYIGLLAKEALEKEFDVADLEQQPEGLAAYLDVWWQELLDVAGERPALLLFATLAAAHGPLARSDLEALVPEAFADPTGMLRDHFDRNILPKIRRLIMGNDAVGYTLAHPRFGQHLSTKFTADVLQSVQERLLEYSRNWSRNASGYALTHLPVHTAEVRPNELAALYQDAHYLAKAIGTLGVDRVIGTLRRVQSEAQLSHEDGKSLHRSRMVLEHEAHNFRAEADGAAGTSEAYAAGQLALQALVMNDRELYESARTYLALIVPNGIYPAWTTNTSSDALLRTLSGHTSVVERATITGGGSRVFTLSLDGSAKLWDIHTGSLIQTLQDSDSPISAGAITPDGDIAVTANGQEESAKVWDVESGNLLFVLEGHTEEVTDVAIAPNKTFAVTTSRDGAYVWDLASGKRGHFLNGHENWLTSVAISPDGQKALTTSWDSTACLWNLGDGKLLFRLEGHRAGVSRGLFSSDSKRALTISKDSTARLWDLENLEVLHELSGHESELTAAVFVPERDEAATAGQDGTIRVWNLSTGQATAVLQDHGQWVTDVVPFGRNGSIASARRDGTIAIWDIASAQMIKSWKGHPGPVKSIAISELGDLAVTAGDDGSARVWDLAAAITAPAPHGHQEAVTSLTYHSEKEELMSASRDATVMVWESGSGDRRLVLDDGGGPITALALAPGAGVLATGSEDRSGRLWDLTGGGLLNRLTGHKAGVTAVAASEPSTRVITGAQDGSMLVWDLEEGTRVLELVGHTKRIASIRVTKDGAQAVSTSWDGTARIWNLETGACTNVLEAHPGPVTDAALAKEGRLVTIGHDDKPRVWNLADGSLLGCLEGHTGPLSTLALSPDGASALTGGWDGSICLWDLEARTSRLVIAPSESGKIVAVAFLADGEHCLSVNVSGLVALRALATGELVQKLQLPSQPTAAIICGQEGNLVAAGENSGAVTVFGFTSALEHSMK
ncbi:MULTISPECIES: AAA family ATPase [Paenarthrobacter]|uniref:Trypsin-like peptidase domain-containing protein n=1 Tax=Paenarthrobacter ureafaciens TaxID=37931 RepID=A0AAX3EM02_PAEUR|nr:MULTISPECIES: AAA family ATPase [Paenarthrobacter]MDO5863758.1 trypsin-like peptidase domain-containing protein [Paenarthrobacter sp. SD-2]MDO5874832.1 trypsin-like peptidase domain-containing protein [Paenarthrobacter sp. SD-1]QMU81729.1 AAA family ATPase [Paenarthrobacter ureafaciens]UYV94216.1 trypsin-like peptidase domain-containing protein [Paenarthrobacter ureafaciens]UYV98743.1 trypsin-like peptidase domain-containing protein [Paenarthrobacter ureafaciens]